MIIRKTLEQLMQTWNPGLSIREIPHLDVDSVMYEGKHVCSIPKGGKHIPWFDFMADADQKESDMTVDGVRHRTFSGLVLTLVKKGIITWGANQQLANYVNDISGKKISK